jgi:O-antigen/teichoic acid export membrane protein
MSETARLVRIAGFARRRLARSFGWGIADQALSSVTNFGLGIAVARVSTPAEFGAFGIAFATCTIATGASRALTTEPLAIRHSGLDRRVWREGTAEATGVALLVGVVAGSACVIAGTLVGENLRGPLIAMGICLPGLLLQDSWRGAFFAGRRGDLSFENDLVWAALLVAGLSLAIVGGHDSVGSLILVWGATGTAAGVFGIAQNQIVPTPGAALRWWREQRDLASRLLTMFAARNLARQVTTYGVAVFGGLAGAGALRGGLLLLGPLNVLYLGVNAVLVPQGVQLGKRSTQSLVAGMRLVATGLAVVSLAWGLALYALPDSIGREILGASWVTSHGVLVPLTVMTAAAAAQLGATAGVLSLGEVRVAMVTQMVEGGLTLTGGFVGAFLGGAPGAAWGLATAFVVEAIMWWVRFRAVLARTGEPLRPDDQLLAAAVGGDR